MELSVKQIETILTNLVSEAQQKIPELNMGGCAIFTHKVVNKLVKLGYSDLIRIRMSFPTFDNENNFINCSHMWLSFNGNDYNENRTLPTHTYRVDKFQKTLKRSIRVDRSCNWNPRFERDSGSSTIDHLIRKHFNGKQMARLKKVSSPF